ncbi:hypothetical protein SAMN04488077_110102 [Roseovarius tolerans]|uniref:Dihydroorotate dehydrogenase n=1 Tax=Roseovarius tolerans TaxID=74031 RepID=A0A1H8CSV6_9RHOB|nr:hypothetical protein [Roseovarius tolerans]SEM98060.1 hypothetical protein SAMN04488077_110102 [Roseovarius tolerans]
MSMSDKDQADGGLDVFFEAARGHAPIPSPDLLARVFADAETTQQAGPSTAPARVSATPDGLAARLYRLLGGWPAMAGLATAALTGIWIGTALPEGLIGTAEAAYLVDITPEMAFDLAGGDF